MDDPQLFFDHLKDHGLISEDLYQKVIKMKSMDRRQNAVYMVLKSLEKEPNKIKEFWSCVFKEHIMLKYPFLRKIQGSLNRFFLLNQNLPWPEKPTGNEIKQVEQKKCGTKRKKSVDETEEEDAGPSSVSSSSQKELFQISFLDDSSEDSDDLSETEDLSKFEATELPVSCGSVTGVLHKRRFRGPHSKSIRTEKRWFSPEEFVKQGPLTDGDWMKNILCHGKTLGSLMEKNKYTTVREFVKDINLIFENYEAFHNDNADSMGTKMKKIFDEEFDTIFKIQ
ncbi:hypothetical protein Q7C36_003932 [Tachysurus vachellii]|uniref:Bromo domain-containing protein n=1 Tax=Tachysurus vachellii TaxID=175792 RepID=A0AA88T6D1_TACVA|nr:hypothetical protein Q7C36_003932 [Tachysurus vachellii]